MNFIIPDEAVENEVYYHVEDLNFQLQNQEALSTWIQNTIQSEDNELNVVNFIFCSDEYLHKINVKYLNHDTYTDVITFPFAESPIEGDIYISIERIQENSQTQGTEFEEELHRVMIHGVLHLLGYGDKSPEDKERMTQKEDEYLGKFKV